MLAKSSPILSNPGRMGLPPPPKQFSPQSLCPPHPTHRSFQPARPPLPPFLFCGERSAHFASRVLTGTDGPRQHVNPTASIETTTVFSGAHPPSVLLFARIKMHLSIRDDRNVSSALQELHYFLAAPRHRRPARFRLGILFQSPQISSVVLKFDLFEFSLCPRSNRKALLFEQYRLPVFDNRLFIY